MDEFAWTDTKAVLYGGILLAIAGVIAVLCFQFVKPATKKLALVFRILLYIENNEVDKGQSSDSHISHWSE